MTQFIKIMNDDELFHVGVMGMRWGKRTGSTATSINRDFVRTANKQKKTALNNSNAAFQKDMKKLQAEGRGNDTNAVIKRSAQWDKERATIRSEHNKVTKTAKRSIDRNNIKVAKSVVTGLLVSNLASAVAFRLTGSPVVAMGVGAYAGIKTGTMMHDKLSDYDPS